MALTDPIRTVTSNEQEPNAEMAALLSSDLLLQIGDAELCSTMPTTSETNRRLYEMIRQKESYLSDLRKKVKNVLSDYTAKKESVDALKAERDFLRTFIETQQLRLSGEVDGLNSAGVEIARIQTEDEAVKQRVRKTERQIREICVDIRRQTALLDSLNIKVDEKSKRKEFINHKLDETQSIQRTLAESFRQDSKTVKDLEIYLKKITKQLYERQREVDLLKLGQLDAKAEADGIKRLIRQLDRRHQHIQQLYNAESYANTDHMAKDMREKLQLSAGSLMPLRREDVGRTEELENALKKLGKAEARVAEQFEELERLNVQNHNLEKQWVKTAETEMNERFELAEIEAQNEVLKKRIDRIKAHLKDIKYEPSVSMYKSFQSGGAANKSTHSSEGQEANAVCKNNKAKLRALHSKLEKLKREFAENAQMITEGSAFVKAPSTSVSSVELAEIDEKSSQSGRGSSSGEEELSRKGGADVKPSNHSDDYPKTPTSVHGPSEAVVAEKTAAGDPEAKLLEELNKKRDNIFNECSKEVLADLRKRKSDLNTEVKLLNGEVKALCNEVETHRTLIGREVGKTGEIKEKIRAIKENIEKRRREFTARQSKDVESTQNEMERLTATAEHLNGSIVELEEQRNKLNADIIQAQVNESNLRNRYNTYRSLKDSKSVGRNELARLDGLASEWQRKVETTRTEVENLQNFLRLTQQQNNPTRRRLTTIRPSYNEEVEYSVLENKDRQLKSELVALRRNV